MRLFEKQRSFVFSVFIVAAVIITAGGGYYFVQQEFETLTSRIMTLENQMSALSNALQESNVISEENKQELKELSNRRDVVAKSQDELLTSAVSNAAPAVVSIVISKDVPQLAIEYVNPFGDDPRFHDFGFRVPTYRQVGTEEKQVGAGTGFLVRSDGYIITNRHVVADPEATYTALLSTGEQKTAQVVYRDNTHDLAVLKISGSGYSALSFTDSSALQLGQTVVAIGNALGEYSNSVSVGIISGLGRTIQAQDRSGRVETIKGAIQTDAAINQGNSGGPLLDLNGNVVGVNVATNRFANDIAFAIPADTVASIVDRVLP